MAPTTPDWLTRRGASVAAGRDGHTWLVYFGKEPQYELSAAPVAGKHGCVIMQTVNGRLLPSGGTYPSAEEALRAGLEDLRRALGW